MTGPFKRFPKGFPLPGELKQVMKPATLPKMQIVIDVDAIHNRYDLKVIGPMPVPLVLDALLSQFNSLFVQFMKDTMSPIRDGNGNPIHKLPAAGNEPDPKPVVEPKGGNPA